jgi:hypothetical protein
MMGDVSLLKESVKSSTGVSGRKQCKRSQVCFIQETFRPEDPYNPSVVRAKCLIDDGINETVLDYRVEVHPIDLVQISLLFQKL